MIDTLIKVWFTLLISTPFLGLIGAVILQNDIMFLIGLGITVVGLGITLAVITLIKIWSEL